MAIKDKAYNLLFGQVKHIKINKIETGNYLQEEAFCGLPNWGGGISGNYSVIRTVRPVDVLLDVDGLEIRVRTFHCPEKGYNQGSYLSQTQFDVLERCIGIEVKLRVKDPKDPSTIQKVIESYA